MMKNFNFTRVPCQLSWKETIDGWPSIHREYMKQHQEMYDKDFDYVGNLDLDFSKFFEVEVQDIGFYSRTVFNSFKGKPFAINDEILADIKANLGFEDCASALQNLESGKMSLVHLDVPNLSNSEKLVPRLYYHLENKHSNFHELSVDTVFNITIIFLENWSHGQAFMIGRQCFVQWKAGDVISIPWYMEHSTVNASFNSRNLLYMAGSFA